MSYLKITSLSNPRLKEALDIKNKRGKYKQNAFIIEGPHLIEAAMSSGHWIREVFFTDGFYATKAGQRLMKQIVKTTDAVVEVTEHIINKLTDTETPQGIVGIASYKTMNLEGVTCRSTPLLVVIDGIQEPGNLGAVVRTSDAAGADAVIILKGTCDVFMQKTVRATAGSIFNLSVVHTETDKLLKWLSSRNIKLIATALDAKQSLFEADLKTPLAFVFGNEAHGISAEMKRNADSLLKIPIPGKAESLNVSASAAICLYETVRQRAGL